MRTPRRNFVFPFGMGIKKKPFKFNPALATFTPSMSKRNSAGPFAAGVMVQGDRLGTPNKGDVLAAQVRTAIKNKFFNHGDEYQGTIVFWITPEWNGNCGVFRSILSGPVSIYIWSNNVLYVQVPGAADLMGYNVASWVAGTTYQITVRWDTKNKIDGTNYACISVNDVHSFGGTSPLTPVSDFTQLVFGSYAADRSPIDAILEGLTIYRRVLFDGTYGQDIGNGDELALIYNAGTGKDPTEITGSWDVVFCLPTNATAGALVTGTGEAWSHPHSSNLLKDGWLADGFYGGGKYALKAGETGNQGYLSIADSAPIQNLLGGAFTCELWARLDSISDPYIFLFSKEKYMLYIDNTGAPGLYLDILTPGDTFTFFLLPLGLDGKWHHFAVTFDDGGDQKPRIYFDGVLGATGNAISSGLQDDSGAELKFSRYYTIGWCRISNSIRYSATFTPPHTPPAPDANTIGQWNMSEGTGTTVDNAEGTAARDGTITNGSWVTVWEDEGTPIVPESVAFNGTTTSINAGSEASLDNLPAGAMTVECYFNGFPDGTFIRKQDHWLFYMSGEHLQSYIALGTTPAQGYKANAGVTNNRWHHVAFTFDGTGDKKIRQFVDGILVSTGEAGVGDASDDSAASLFIGSNSGANFFIHGAFGWLRISNSIRYTANFIPPSRVAPPANDANTVRLFAMNEGTGTVITDSSTNAQNATLSNGSWNTVRDMAIDSPGARTYNWGHVLGSDAADEGIKQTFVGLTPGSDYVIRALAYSEDGIGQPRLVVYDETNGAEISHLDAFGQQDNLVLNPGFDNGASWAVGDNWSIGSGKATHSVGTLGQVYQNLGLIIGRFYHYSIVVSGRTAGILTLYVGIDSQPKSISLDGTYTGTILCAGDSYLHIFGDADFDGSIDDVQLTLIPDEQHPEPLIFSFELPTVARAGVAADCVSMSVKLVNAANDGVVGWNQVELLANLIDNPSLDYGAVADPFIPDGWVGTFDAGDLVQESSIINSSAAALKFNTGATVANYLSTPAISLAIGRFVSYGQTVRGFAPALFPYSGVLIPQSTLDGAIGDSFQVNKWLLIKHVVRQGTVSTVAFFYGNGNVCYLDDVYAFALDDVSLTATPASLANSQESGGIRVDGNDILTQPITKWKATKGELKFTFIPRHPLATTLSFGWPAAYVFRTDGPGTFFYAYLDTTSIILVIEDGSGSENATYALAGILVPGVPITIRAGYTATEAYLFVNGIKAITISTPINFGANVPTNCWFVCPASGEYKPDAVVL